MISENELSPEALEVAQKIEKLLRLASDKSNEHVAANAASKAAELMAAYNLSTAAIEQNTGDKGKRLEQKFKAGHKEWQRNLWRDVAKLNFCLHTVVNEVQPIWKTQATNSGFKRVKVRDKFTPVHRIVGRIVNVKATQAMAQYLEHAIERLTIDECNERDIEYYSTWANSFREGMAERICEKVYDRQIEQDRRQREEAETKAREAAARGRENTSMERALTLSDVRKSEEEANRDFLDPERHARRAKYEAEIAERRAREAKAKAEADAAWTKWCEDHPEEARKLYEKQQAEAEAERKRQEKNARRRAAYVSTGYRYYREPKQKGDAHARRAGYERGESVSIDLQTEGGKTAGRIG